MFKTKFKNLKVTWLLGTCTMKCLVLHDVFAYTLTQGNAFGMHPKDVFLYYNSAQSSKKNGTFEWSSTQ
jgi:hypothetical protein